MSIAKKAAEVSSEAYSEALVVVKNPDDLKDKLGVLNER